MSSVSLVRARPKQQGEASVPQYWYEHMLSRYSVFHGENELGPTGRFLRLDEVVEGIPRLTATEQ